MLNLYSKKIQKDATTKLHQLNATPSQLREMRFSRKFYVKEVAEEPSHAQKLTPPPNEDELAFFDAVALNESAVQEQGEGILADIARQLVKVMRKDVRTDWTVREDVRAKLRTSIKRLLIINGYPPDKQPEAIKLVIEQMETMAQHQVS